MTGIGSQARSSRRPGKRTPPKETCLGFDFGLKRIGVAVGQSITGTASPLETLGARDGIPDWQSIADLVEAWKPAVLVVGLPLNADGSEHDITRAARRFARRLHGRFGLPVPTIDERLSSDEAGRRMLESGSRQHGPGLDAVAAQVILETWLSQSRRTPS